ncbi:peptidyl-prolyl cis-trans isomerase [Anaeromyxobacter sp. Fw109-5]|uniref:peptidylprolyl isomerase n=1 Tax=Anaeromyxobacter sp. (strain Fw109-5) TaxID=404589 RepID=UPI00059CA581|nr:peptidylprolyl isomerase [Anaeromyxobacter sp. Fw109-5]
MSIRVRVPLADERFGPVPVATVADEVITVDDLRELAAITHQDRAEGMTGKADFTKLVERLVAVRTIVAEARAIGLDDLEEVKKPIADNKERIRFDLVRKHASKDVTVDPAEVKRLYDEARREWRIRSVFFGQEAEAKKFTAALAAGGEFDALAKKAAEDKVARSGEGSQWIRVSEIQVSVAKEVEKLAPGKATAPLKAGPGWTVVRLDEKRSVEDEALRAKIESTVRGEAVAKALQAYYAKLKKQLVRIDTKLLRAVSFDKPKGGFEALRKDRRVVARVEGAKPVTLGEVAESLARPLFHGVAPAQEQGKLDKQKQDALDALVSKRLVTIEAERLRLDDTPEAKRRAAEFETNLLFTTFIDRVVIPEVKVTEAEDRAAYEKRKDEFKYPAFYRLEGLAFQDAKNAQKALKSLQGGTDFKWLRSNSDGLVPEEEQVFRLDATQTISARAMPEEFRKALAGAQDGDVRLVASKDQHYVVRVAQFTPESVRPFEEVRPEIHKDVFGTAIARALDGWVEKLRDAHEVNVYLVTSP